VAHGVVEADIAVAHQQQTAKTVGGQLYHLVAVFVRGIGVCGEMAVFVGRQSAENGGEPQGTVGCEGHRRDIFYVVDHHNLLVVLLLADVLAGAEPEGAILAEGVGGGAARQLMGVAQGVGDGFRQDSTFVPRARLTVANRVTMATAVGHQVAALKVAGDTTHAYAVFGACTLYRAVGRIITYLTFTYRANE